MARKQAQQPFSAFFTNNNNSSRIRAAIFSLGRQKKEGREREAWLLASTQSTLKSFGIQFKGKAIALLYVRTAAAAAVVAAGQLRKKVSRLKSALSLTGNQVQN